MADALSRNPFLAEHKASAVCLILPAVLAVTTRSQATKQHASFDSQEGGGEKGHSLCVILCAYFLAPISLIPCSAISRYPCFEDPKSTKAFQCDEHGLWRLQGRFVLSGDPQTRKRVLEAYHVSPMCGHVAVTKTLELVSHDFWWHGLRPNVEHHVRLCDEYRCNKGEHSKECWQAPASSCSWEAIGELSKMAHLVATPDNLGAKAFADLFFQDVVRLHGRPDELVPDRGPQFNNNFRRAVFELTGMKCCLSSAYHPQSDGQMERTIRTIVEMLRSYVKPDQLGSLAAMGGICHPLLPAYLNKTQKVPEAYNFLEDTKKVEQGAKRCLDAARQHLILLSTRNSGSEKLLPKRSFRVEEMVGPVAVCLQLPPQWSRIHNVQLVRPYLSREKRLNGLGITPPPPAA
eukprot:1157662-Pelagomonas_calceolata.AAC.3